MAVLLLSAIAVGGCNTSNDSRIVRTTAEQPETLPNGRLKSQPSPMTLADVERHPAGSPQKAVMQLLFYAQWGSLPNVVEGYAPQVLRRVNAQDIAGAYAMQRPALVALLPRIVGVRKTKEGRFVAVQFVSTGPPQANSFLLQRTRGQWKVIYDTVLDRSLAEFATREADPSPTPSKRAVRKGILLSSSFRRASTGKSIPPRPRPAPTPVAPPAPAPIAPRIAPGAPAPQRPSTPPSQP